MRTLEKSRKTLSSADKAKIIDDPGFGQAEKESSVLVERREGVDRDITEQIKPRQWDPNKMTFANVLGSEKCRFEWRSSLDMIG